MSNETERTLHELKLPGMASCWSSLEETHQLDKLTLREGMQIMLQYERDTRGNNRIQRLIKNAGFRLRASMEELETDTARGIQACSAADLATGNYITGGMTVIITGPAGTGKSYFACALGDRACRNGRKVLYFTMNMLIENLKLVHLEGRETNFFRKLNAHDLLIIDDLGTELTNSFTTSQLFLCLNERILHRKSTIISTNLGLSQLTDLYSERILSRIMDNYVLIKLFGEDIRMQKRRR